MRHTGRPCWVTTTVRPVRRTSSTSVAKRRAASVAGTIRGPARGGVGAATREPSDARTPALDRRGADRFTLRTFIIYANCQVCANYAIGLPRLPVRGPGEFVDEVGGGTIPRQYIPAVENGIREAMPRQYIPRLASPLAA